MGKVDIWMPVYIGDYLRDTEELTCMEHGAYLLLLMHYWQKGGEIGCDIGRLARVCRSDEETARFILGYYFILENGNYKNKRADDEMIKAESRRLSAEENGRKGGRPPKNNPQETARLAKQNPPVSQMEPDHNPTHNPQKSSSPSSSSSQSSSESNSRASSLDTTEVSPEEAHAPIPEPEPEEEQQEPGAYPKVVYAAWEALGAHVYQPASLWAFSQKWGQQVRPHLKGIHSKDVLQALENLKAIYEAPTGTYYWTQKIGVEAFFSKHLEKFLPANFNPDDFKKRLSFIEQQEAETRASYLQVFGHEMGEEA